jgi:hypothetical protein
MMNWKGCGRKQSWLNFKVLSRHLPGGTENYGNCQDSQSPGQDFNLGPPKYEEGMFTTQP